MSNLIGGALRDQRRFLVGWFLGLGVYALIYMSFYGRFNELGEAKLAAMPEGLRNAFSMNDVQTGAGYLNAIIFGLFAPLLVIVFGITMGGRLLAAMEEDGVLDLQLANPVSRVRFLACRYATLLFGMVTGAAIISMIIVAFAVGKDMGVPIADIVSACLGLFLVGLAFSSIAFAVGAVTGSRALALGTAGTLAVAGYICKTLPEMIDSMTWLKWLSPFYWAAGYDPVNVGLRPWAAVLFVLLITGAVTAGAAWFNRRDLGV